MSDWVLETHFVSLGDLIPEINLRSSAERVDAELDGVVLGESDSVDYCVEVLREPEAPELLAAVTLAVFKMQVTGLYPETLKYLNGDSPEFREAVRLGLRLSSIAPVIGDLRQLARSENTKLETRVAVADLLSFHRVRFELAENGFDTLEEPDLRCQWLGAVGRMRLTHWLDQFASDTDPKIRKQFWKAMARARHPETMALCCQRVVDRQPCYDAIRFLGLIASPEEAQVLRRVAQGEHRVPAIEALGLYGGTEIIGDLVRWIADEDVAQVAALALERVTGRGVPRNDPGEPPTHLTEDELDFWSDPGKPKAHEVERWWKQNRYAYQAAQRYQAGQVVSQNPLGPIFDQLPDEIREAVYLRACARQGESVPDWELETWPKYQRRPDWASG